MVPVMREPHTNLTERRVHTHVVPPSWDARVVSAVRRVLDDRRGDAHPQGQRRGLPQQGTRKQHNDDDEAGLPACLPRLPLILVLAPALPCPAVWSQLKSRYGRHAAYVAPRVDSSSGSFGVRHYAGPVVYDVAGFIEKNRDTLSADVMQALQVGTNHDQQQLPLPLIVLAAHRSSAVRQRGKRCR